MVLAVSSRRFAKFEALRACSLGLGILSVYALCFFEDWWWHTFRARPILPKVYHKGLEIFIAIVLFMQLLAVKSLAETPGTRPSSATTFAKDTA